MRHRSILSIRNTMEYGAILDGTVASHMLVWILITCLFRGVLSVTSGSARNRIDWCFIPSTARGLKNFLVHGWWSIHCKRLKKNLHLTSNEKEISSTVHMHNSFYDGMHSLIGDLMCFHARNLGSIPSAEANCIMPSIAFTLEPNSAFHHSEVSKWAPGNSGTNFKHSAMWVTPIECTTCVTRLWCDLSASVCGLKWCV